MNFYYAHYKRQRYDEKTGKWSDTYYTCQGIVVLADCYTNAKKKVEACLSKVECGNYRAVLTSDVKGCIGLDLRQGFEGSFDVLGIYEEKTDYENALESN